MANGENVTDLENVLATGTGKDLKQLLYARDTYTLTENYTKETRGIGTDTGGIQATTDNQFKQVLGTALDARDIDAGFNIGFVMSDLTGAVIAFLSAPFEGMRSGVQRAENYINEVYSEAEIKPPSRAALEFNRMMREVYGKKPKEKKEKISLKDIKEDIMFEAAPYAYAMLKGINEEDIKEEIKRKYGDTTIKLKRFGKEEEVPLWELIYGAAKRAYLKYETSREKHEERETALRPYGDGVSGIPPVYYRGGIGIDKVMEKYKELYNEDPEKAKKVAKYTILTYLAAAEAHKHSSIGEYSKGLRVFTKAEGFYEKLMKVLEE